ncbi:MULTISPECIES: PH domain-containing protein [Nocardiaceae]|uniref:PH domain-containing protein n=1 Tax=Nocardiaceae TaxID=85025 RepID=UPI001482074D|nr:MULTISPECIES: PH domain-containing protein [Rhodococcus]
MWIKPVDESGSHPQNVDNLSWATPLPAVIALTVGGFALLVAAFLTDNDPAGRVLISIGALGLWIIAGLAAYQRPRLWIDSAGRLSVKRLSGIHTYTRDEISRITLVPYPRLGRRVPMLELNVRHPGEDDDRLVIFGRWDLGTSPQNVYDALEQRGFVEER